MRNSFWNSPEHSSPHPPISLHNVGAWSAHKSKSGKEGDLYSLLIPKRSLRSPGAAQLCRVEVTRRLRVKSAWPGHTQGPSLPWHTPSSHQAGPSKDSIRCPTPPWLLCRACLSPAMKQFSVSPALFLAWPTSVVVDTVIGICLTHKKPCPISCVPPCLGISTSLGSLGDPVLADAVC